MATQRANNRAINRLANWVDDDATVYVKSKASIIKYDADDTLPNYVGYNDDPAAADGATTWVITKHTYSAGAITQSVTKVGTWTGRAALF